MGVPLLDLHAQYLPLRDALVDAVTRVCDSQRFIMGEDVAALESELAAMLNVEHAIAVSSGTDALLLALMALDIGPGDEVVTSAYSFFATAGCIVRVGARPVFVDIDPVTFNLDTSQLAGAITSRTRAIVPVHLFGLSAELDPVLAEAAKRGIAVIEDAAQAIGSLYRGRTVGGCGEFGCLSFFPSKNLGAFGDAGLVMSRDTSLAKRARLMRTHGMEPRYYHHVVGGNFRMDSVQAAVLRVKARHLEAWTEGRRLNARRYAHLFEELRISGVVHPVEPAGFRHIYNQYVIRIEGEVARDALRRHLAERGIGTEIYYPVPLPLQPCFANLGHREGDFPHSERAARESLALPIYAELTIEQQREVVRAIADFF